MFTVTGFAMHGNAAFCIICCFFAEACAIVEIRETFDSRVICIIVNKADVKYRIWKGLDIEKEWQVLET